MKSELELIKPILDTNNDKRVPVLLLSSSTSLSEYVDQVVIFDSDSTIAQVHNLLNSSFLFFLFNSSEHGILRILGTILASIEYRGTIPIFIDTGSGLPLDQKKNLGECYFHFDLSNNINRKGFSIFLESVISVLSPTSGLGVSFSDLIQIFGKSENLFYGISQSTLLEEVLEDLVDQIGEKLVQTLPEELESLEAIFISVISGKSISLQTMNRITAKFASTFGREFNIHFSNSVESNLQGFKTLVILTDLHPINEIFPVVNPFMMLEFDNETEDASSELTFSSKEKENDKENEEEMRFHILGKIFSESEVYIFDDGGLPLFASHRPAGQEVCLYTGLFSAIQSMSSDLIGHSPDHLTAGDKECVFITQKGPNQMQLRGVAICQGGQEETARNDLKVSMDLVHRVMLQGEPEYAINDKIQGILVKSFQKGELTNGFALARYQAS
ncbi:MAG: hypothetical protein ACW98F_03250 [Candidatus Hodarchaeales archaeon]